MWRWWLVVLVVSGVAACSHPPTLVPDPPTETRFLARAAAAGVTLEVVANAWHEYPSAVAEQLTPLWVHVRNDGDSAFDITYAALQLVDDQGRLYAAVPPMEVVRMVIGSAPAPVREVQVAELESDAPNIELAQFGFGMGMGPDPMWGSPTSPYGYAQNGNAAASILRRALREGRLLAHTQAMGFVYFQRAYDGRVLTLRLDAPAEVAGAAPLALEARFSVQR